MFVRCVEQLIFRVLKWAKPSIPALLTILAMLIAIPVFSMYYENLRVNTTVETGETDARITDVKGYVIQYSCCCCCNCSCNCACLCCNQSDGCPSCHSTTTASPTTTTTTITVRGSNSNASSGGGECDCEHGFSCEHNCSNCEHGCGHDCNYTECVAMEPSSLVLGPEGQYLDVFVDVNISDGNHHIGHDNNCTNEHKSCDGHGCCECCGCGVHRCHNNVTSQEFWVGIVFENTGTIPVVFTHLTVVDVSGNITSWEVVSRFYGQYEGSPSSSPVWGAIECYDLPISGNVLLPMQLEPGEKAVVWTHIIIDNEGQFQIRITPSYVQFNMAP